MQFCNAWGYALGISLMMREEDMVRTFMVILGVLVILAVGATIYMGPAQVLQFAGGLVSAGDAVDAGSGSEAVAPQASPEPNVDADGSKQETPGDIDEHTGAITYLVDLPEGARVQLSITDRAAILDGCAESIRRALQGFPETKKPEAAVIFSCAARRILLGTKTGEEFRILKESIGDEVPFCGFYTYGEIGPQQTDRTKPVMHDATFIILLFGT